MTGMRVYMTMYRCIRVAQKYLLKVSYIQLKEKNIFELNIKLNKTILNSKLKVSNVV